MSEPEAAAEARRWLRSAGEDLRIVRMALGEDPPVVGPACFHSQHAAEKALKAALVLEGIEFPYVHDLRRLRNLLPDGWPGGPPNIALQRLTEWGAESRYPIDWPALTAEAAAGAEADARTDPLDAVTRPPTPIGRRVSARSTRGSWERLPRASAESGLSIHVAIVPRETQMDPRGGYPPS